MWEVQERLEGVDKWVTDLVFDTKQEAEAYVRKQEATDIGIQREYRIISDDR